MSAAPSSESLLNWWYPNNKASATSGNITTTVEVHGGNIIKTEVVIPDDDEEESDSENDVEQGMEMEDIEIIPEEDNNDPNDEDEDEEDDSDPSYDPLSAPSSSRYANRPNSKSRPSLNKTPGPGKPGTKAPITTISLSSDFEVIPSCRGHPLIAKEGYMFNFGQYNRERASWRCCRMKKKCHVLLYTGKDMSNLSLLMETGTHNHPPDQAAVEKKKMLNKIMIDAASCDDTVEEIIARHIPQNAENPVNVKNIQNIRRGIRVLRAASGRGPPITPVRPPREKKEIIYFVPPTQ